MAENSRKINILFLFAKLVIGGAERTIIDLVPRLDRSRFNPLVVYLKEKGAFGEEMERRGVPVIEKLAANRFDVSVLPKLGRIIKRHKTNAIYTLDHDNAMFWGRLATLAFNIPVSLTVIHTTVRRDGTDTLNWIGKMFMPLTDGLIATAAGSREYLIKQQGVHSRKVPLIYNGVDLEGIQKARREKKLSKGDFGIPEDAKVVGIVAAFKPEKAHHIFLQAAKKILEKDPNVYFLLVGDGPQRKVIEQTIQELNLQDRAFITGFRKDMPDVFQVLDVSALSSDPRCETFSLTILESMAAGLPAVVTRVGSMDEMVFDDVNGYLVPPRDPESLAEAICKVIGDDERQRRFGQNSMRIANERFQVDRMVRETEELIESIYRNKVGKIAVTGEYYRA